MSRLIDADKLIEDLKESYDECEIQTVLEYFGIYEFIKEQPTAYDVEKVREQLEELRVNAFDDEFIIINDAIEIVERGGIDEKCK